MSSLASSCSSSTTCALREDNSPFCDFFPLPVALNWQVTSLGSHHLELRRTVLGGSHGPCYQRDLSPVCQLCGKFFFIFGHCLLIVCQLSVDCLLIAVISQEMDQQAIDCQQEVQSELPRMGHLKFPAAVSCCWTKSCSKLWERLCISAYAGGRSPDKFGSVLLHEASFFFWEHAQSRSAQGGPRWFSVLCSTLLLTWKCPFEAAITLNPNLFKFKEVRPPVCLFPPRHKNRWQHRQEGGLTYLLKEVRVFKARDWSKIFWSRAADVAMQAACSFFAWRTVWLYYSKTKVQKTRVRADGSPGKKWGWFVESEAAGRYITIFCAHVS